MNTNKSGWEILKASVSERNGGLYIEGVNHETTNPLDRSFHWHVRDSLDDPRFDWSGCVFAPRARETLERLNARG